ncbi:putative secologanin synthase [Dioscorea sansibarensis]
MMTIMMLCTVGLPALLVCGWRTLDWVWFTPRRIEREFRWQGLCGTHYRIFHSDSKDFARLSEFRWQGLCGIHFLIMPSKIMVVFHYSLITTLSLSLSLSLSLYIYIYIWVNHIKKSLNYYIISILVT